MDGQTRAGGPDGASPGAGRTDGERADAYRFALDTVLDGMRANVYVTDPATDEILYMNRYMREDYGLDRPEGTLCWQTLQRNLDRRCPFCPVDKLEAAEPGRLVEWEETSSKTGRVYRNCDSLIRWFDGSLVHLQQSVDITDVKTASIDELAELLTRRVGKGRLQARMDRERDEDDVFSVCLFDINRLKEINDRFGHAEGDVVLRAAADAARSQLSGEEFAFRLSGDEFVCVVEGDAAEARGKMERADDLLSSRVKGDLRETGFCFGIVEVHGSDTSEVNEVLTMADERMYEQKRRLHIGRSEARAQEALERNSALTDEDVGAFAFDVDLLYDALVDSTDDYLYVCNMKTGVFRYPQAMVEEFGLPAQVVADAAAVWGSHVHPDDRQAFLESNQDIVDGRTTRHCVEYRALNRAGEYVWLRCRGMLMHDGSGEPSLFAGFIANLEKKNKVDHLTGLFNKFEFEDVVRRALETRPDERLGLMVLGIDDLRHINDRYDRGFGDDVIRIIAHRIQSALVGRAHVYRLDGDEFAVVARGDDAATLPDVYQALHQSFRRQQTHEGKKFYCTLSAGCAQYPADADTYEDLVKFANYALEYAKAHGKKRRVPFSPGILAERSRTLELVERLRDSIEHGFEGFRLVFQPQVNAADGRVIGAEALARWSCDACGEVPPLEFIPLLEESGLIVPFGAWVLHRAMETAARWRAWVPRLRHEREPVVPPARRGQARAQHRRGAGRHGPAAGEPGGGDDRELLRQQQRGGPEAVRRRAGAGRAHRHGRLRHGLRGAGHAEAVAGRHREDRPHVRARHPRQHVRCHVHPVRGGAVPRRGHSRVPGGRGGAGGVRGRERHGPGQHPGLPVRPPMPARRVRAEVPGEGIGFEGAGRSRRFRDGAFPCAADVVRFPKTQ